MKLREALTTAVLAGSLYAPGQDGFIVHLNTLQAGRSGAGLSVREVPSGYLLFSNQFGQSTPSSQHNYTRLLDPNGQLLSELEFFSNDVRDFDIGYIDPVAQGPDGTFAAAISEGFDYDGATSFYVFDETGDTLSRRVNMVWPYTDSIAHAVRQIRAMGNNGGFVSCGFFARPNESTRAYLVRYTSAGDTLWTRQYGIIGQSMVALGVEPHSTGGFVLMGYRNYGVPLNRSFMIRTDENGNLEWTRYFGGYATQNGAVRSTLDGSIFTWSSYLEEFTTNDEEEMLLRKWDGDGNVVWEYRSPSLYFGSSFDMEVLPSGHIITTHVDGITSRLMKFSSEGDSLWSRGYSVTNGQNYLYDVTPTSDGGFVCTGLAYRFAPLDPGFQQSQTIWVLKTDSVGCVVPGCHTVGVEEYALDLNEYLRITPNPVLAGQSLHFTFDPPIEHEAPGPRRMLLLDAMGRQVREETIHGTGHSTSTADLSPGLYYLHLTDGTRWLAGGKVVLE